MGLGLACEGGNLATKFFARKKLVADYNKLIDLKITSIQELRPEQNINFEFNSKRLAVNQTFGTLDNSKKVGLLSAFRYVAEIDDAVIKTVDISNAELSDTQLNELISFGIGKVNAETLILRNNKLTDEAIVSIARKVTDSKINAFDKLKKIDLSGNKLTSNCLANIAVIVKHLDIQVLNLSNNDFQGEENFNNFLMQHLSACPALKKIYLKNTNLSANASLGITSFLHNINLVRTLDIRDNSNISIIDFNDEILPKGLKHNISLTKFKTDCSNELVGIELELERHKKTFAELATRNPQYNFEDNKRLEFLVNIITGNSCTGEIQRVLNNPLYYRKNARVRERTGRFDNNERLRMEREAIDRTRNEFRNNSLIGEDISEFEFVQHSKCPRGLTMYYQRLTGIGLNDQNNQQNLQNQQQSEGLLLQGRNIARRAAN